MGLSGDLKIWKKVTDKVLKVTPFLDSLAYAVFFAFKVPWQTLLFNSFKGYK